MVQLVMALNAGSSSVKFSVCRAGEGVRAQAVGPVETVLAGQVERIGIAPRLSLHDGAGTVLAERRWAEADVPFATLLAEILAQLDRTLGGQAITALGHRVVHGGPDHAAPQRVTPELIAALEALTPLAPLHMPHNLAPMRAMAALRPDLPQVACFDTAFHHDLPLCARRFALPQCYEADGIRRYGFHGLSYDYVARYLRHALPHLAQGRVVVAHLGSGASLCALSGGRSMDTTMGFSPLDGLIMGTRCGALDPAIVLYLQEHYGLGIEAIRTLLYQKSGLLALSGGLSSDMHVLLGDPSPLAAQAVEQFVYRLAQDAAAMVSALGGVDGFVFTAGIGEHEPPIRARLAQSLAWLGMRIDAGANARNSGLISTADSAMEVHVLPTDEDAMIVLHTTELLSAQGGPAA
ncbi:acetate/propionate family kinase [Acetobacter sp. TBRC 12305]|uniref:Acetate kinase n=1 Tax=Acetobacter garciniae TaxID=2817435 RepID=A0A939KQF2_9PROT|nr:acetate/propionate family kinase [Acetobacter garciniae]MBO1325257.1 acetate/propionate family kinase [Acetobacter garciniae]MBX0344771.1 acetate/propionate family kinase [Acetobacter garciniae]